MTMADWYQHAQALVESSSIGAGTRIWAFTHILPGAVIGADCNICDHVFIENDVRLGDRVTIKSGVQLWDGVALEHDVFVGPNATFTNDRFPRSKKPPPSFLRITVRAGASIGANATILPDLEIGSQAMVGAGAVVTRSVPPHAIVAGNPARIIGYAESSRCAPQPAAGDTAPRSTGVRGVTIHQLPAIKDLRGNLTVAELGHDLPFQPRRVFLVYDVPSVKVRGEHAHRSLHQLLICVHGRCSLVVDDGSRREEILLDRPSIGVYLEPMVWATQYRFSADAALLVLASDLYNADDYLRDYEQWRRLVNAHDAS